MITAQRNPFRTSQIEKLRYIFKNGDWSQLFARLELRNNRGAVVGPHGSGKTTLLEELRSILVGKGEEVILIRLTSEQHKLSSRLLSVLRKKSKDHGWILLDGAEQIPRLAWIFVRFITRSAKGVVITSHNEGRLPTLWMTHSDLHTVELLLNMLEQGQTSMSNSRLGLLFEQSNGNVREILRECYFSFPDKNRT